MDNNRRPFIAPHIEVPSSPRTSVPYGASKINSVNPMLKGTDYYARNQQTINSQESTPATIRQGLSVQVCRKFYIIFPR